MPTYEYECRRCGHHFEKFQSIMAAPVKTCPKCRGRVARVVSGGAGIIFKGTGFYETDYKKKQSPSSCPAPAGSGKAAKANESKKDNAKSTVDQSA
ncbi:MAG: zinc ribbon domain-containing protein [Kiritimatiellae bacterium]|jgi:putative FmdB family regulatory protein|nr:zinc ribbon domain-containing protein [Kiritimatiellia bacterium]MDY0149065.1 zinc ribbon domain-containing protein [Kiritimatiellia bacterium]